MYTSKHLQTSEHLKHLGNVHKTPVDFGADDLDDDPALVEMGAEFACQISLEINAIKRLERIEKLFLASKDKSGVARKPDQLNIKKGRPPLY
jgi:hypothetical protein